MANESLVWKRVRKAAAAVGVHTTRLECRFPPGWPDLDWRIAQRGGLMELKDDDTLLRPAQAIVARTLSRVGANIHVVARRRGVIYLIPSTINTGRVIDYESAIGIWPENAIDPVEFWTRAGALV
jgi:hypothetical protein